MNCDACLYCWKIVGFCNCTCMCLTCPIFQAYDQVNDTGAHVDVDITRGCGCYKDNLTRQPFQDMVGGCGLTSPIVGVYRFEGCKTRKNACTIGKSFDFVIVKAFILILQFSALYALITGLSMWKLHQ